MCLQETIINGLFIEVVKSLGGGKFSKWEPLTLEEAGGLVIFFFWNNRGYR